MDAWCIGNDGREDPDPDQTPSSHVDYQYLTVRPAEEVALQSESYAKDGRPHPSTTTAHAPFPFHVYHPSFAAVLGASPSIRVLARGDYSFAHEAGIYDPHGDQIWITSNILSGHDKDTDIGNVHDDGAQAGPTIHPRVRVQISRVELASGMVHPVDVPGVRMGNGGCPYGDKLLFCDQGRGTSEPSQLVLVDLANPEHSTVLLNNYHGRPFNSLNDVVVLPPVSGTNTRETIWFTDPPYGHEQGFRPAPALPPHVYCFDPVSGVVRVVADGFAHPNGIAFSPAGDVCYVTDSSHIHGTGERFPQRPATIYAFDVVWPAGAVEDVAPYLANKRVFAFADNFVPDGIKCDDRGNVYAGCGDGLHIWNRYGVLIGKIILGAVDDNPSAGCANFCFAPGGRIACFAEDRVYLVEGLQVEGALKTLGAQ